MAGHSVKPVPLVAVALVLAGGPVLAQEPAAGGESVIEEEFVEEEPAPEQEPPAGDEAPISGPALAPGETSVSEPGEEAEEDEAEVEEEELEEEEEVIVSMPSGGQVIQHGDVVFSAMGAAGLAVIDVSDPVTPVVLMTLPVDGTVKALQIVDQTLVVILDDFRTVPLDISDPRNPVPQGEGVVVPKEPPPPPIEGKVGKVKKGWIVLNIGRADGVAPGMKFAIYGKESYSKPRAVITISKVTENNASAPLPPRGSAEKGDRAVKTDLTWRGKYWMSPMPTPGFFKIALDFKPIIGVDNGAGSWGFLAGLELVYKFKAPAEVGLVLRPGSFASSDGKGGVFEFGAMGGVNHRFIGYTWGVGGHLSVGLKDNHVLLLNKLRLGNDDGFHVEFFFTWTVPKEDTGSRIETALPTATCFTIDIPVKAKLNLYLELGGGNLALLDEADNEGTGWANFLLGVRTFLAGAGGSGSLILTTGVGLGYVWDHTPRDATQDEGGATWGPLLHLGLDWRI